MSAEIKWACDNEDCEEYEIDVSFPVEVDQPRCEACGEPLSASTED